MPGNVITYLLISVTTVTFTQGESLRTELYCPAAAASWGVGNPLASIQVWGFMEFTLYFLL